MVTSSNQENSLLTQTKNKEFSTLNHKEFPTISTSGIIKLKPHPSSKLYSAKESIRRKLTARIIPMTRNDGSDLEKKLDDDSKNSRKHSPEKRSSSCNMSTPTTTTTTTTNGCMKTSTIRVKTEKHEGFSCQESRPYHGKHRSSERYGVEPQSKFQKMNSASTSTATPVTTSHLPNYQQYFNPESKRFVENVPMMSLLTASQGHLATLQDDDGDTPLHIAIAQCQVSLVQYLTQMTLASGISLDIYNKLKQTPLHLAVITNQPSIIRILIGAGVDANIPDRNGQAAVHLACQRSSVECLMELVNCRFPIHFEAKNYNGLTPLHEAVISNSPDIIQFLVACGANIDTKDGKSGRTPLHYAVELELLPVMQILIKSGANVSAASFAGSTPIQIASGRGMHQVLRLLLGSINEANKNTGSTATSSKMKGTSRK